MNLFLSLNIPVLIIVINGNILTRLTFKTFSSEQIKFYVSYWFTTIHVWKTIKYIFTLFSTYTITQKHYMSFTVY